MEQLDALPQISWILSCVSVPASSILFTLLLCHNHTTSKESTSKTNGFTKTPPFLNAPVQSTRSPIVGTFVQKSTPRRFLFSSCTEFPAHFPQRLLVVVSMVGRSRQKETLLNFLLTHLSSVLGCIALHKRCRSSISVGVSTLRTPLPPPYVAMRPRMMIRVVGASPIRAPSLTNPLHFTHPSDSSQPKTYRR